MTYTQAQKFQETYENIKSKHFPIAIAYKLMHLNAAAADCIKFFETQYYQIINEYAEHDENGDLIYNEDQSFKVAPDRIMEAQKRLNELTEFEALVAPDSLLTLDELKDLNEKCELSLADLETFMFVTENKKPTE